MNFLQKLFFTEKKNNDKQQSEERAIGAYGENIGALMFGSCDTFSSQRALNLSAVYRAVEIISSGVAQLPIYPYSTDANEYKIRLTQHPLNRILNRKPNNRMTRYTLIKTAIQSMLLRGNAYIYIKRNGKEVEQLVYIPSEYVTIIPPVTIFDEIEYNVVGIGKVKSNDIIHIRNYSHDGIIGVSTLTYARETLQLANDSEENARSFFNSGCNINGVLQCNTTLTSKQKLDIKSSWMQAFGSKSSGGQNSGLAVLEGNMSYQPISVNPADSQLLESRQFNVVEIARFFNVPPTMLFDLSNSNYNTSEAMMLNFLQQTLQPIIVRIEEEFNLKLFGDLDTNIEVRFDTSQLLRTDKTALADYYQKLYNIGVMSINEIRKEIDLTELADGDTHFVPANLLSVKAAANNTPANSAIHSETPTEEKQPLNENTQMEQKTARKKK